MYPLMSRGDRRKDIFPSFQTPVWERTVPRNSSFIPGASAPRVAPHHQHRPLAPLMRRRIPPILRRRNPTALHRVPVNVIDLLLQNVILLARPSTSLVPSASSVGSACGWTPSCHTWCMLCVLCGARKNPNCWTSQPRPSCSICASNRGDVNLFRLPSVAASSGPPTTEAAEGTSGGWRAGERR
jgi:hypothetical protein